MSLKPLGHRVLVKPDPQPTESDGGIVLLENRHHVPVSGVVADVGEGWCHDPSCARCRVRVRMATIRDCIRTVEEMEEMFAHPAALQYTREELGRLLGTLVKIEPEVHVWDRVAFPAEAGLRVSEGGEDYIILNEADLVVLATEDEEAAA